MTSSSGDRGESPRLAILASTRRSRCRDDQGQDGDRRHRADGVRQVADRSPRCSSRSRPSSSRSTTPASSRRRSTACRRTRSRPPRRSTSPATSGSATSPSSARSATAAAPAAASSGTRRWRWPPASATWPWPGAAASGARRRAGRGRRWRDGFAGQHQWTRPFGLLRPVDEIAMLARRYFHEFGGTREQLAVRGRRGASSRQPQPGAMMHEKPLTVDAVPRGALDLRAARACTTTASSPTAPAPS